MDNQTRLNDIKAEIRSLVISSPVGLTIGKFVKDYTSSIGRPLPFKEFGCKSATEFLHSLKDVVQIEYTERGPVLVAVKNKQVAHVNDLVQYQKKQSHSRFSPKRPDMITVPNTSAENYSVQKTVPKVNKTSESLKIENKTMESSKPNENTPQKSDSVNNIADFEKCEIHSVSSDISFDPLVNKDENKDNKKGELEVAINSSVLNEKSRNISPNGSYGSDRVSERMKENFREILQEHSRGISCSKLCSAYKEKFGYPLEVQDLGYDSLRELILSLPGVFTFEKTKFSPDWILYDARINPRKNKLFSNDGTPLKWIPNCVLDNIANLVQKHSAGIDADLILKLYEVEYGVRIDVKKLGFENVPSFLSNCNGIQFKIVNDKNLVVPKSKKKCLLEEPELSDSQNALPPYKDMVHLWKEYFSEEVCDPCCEFEKFVIIESDQFRTKVSDVHSPDYVFLQPVDYGARLSKLMLDLNTFYDDVEGQYVMPINVMKPGLVCCAKFAIDNTWYRARINGVSKHGFNVSYVDYGTIFSDVKPSDIRFLHKKFLEDPIQAIRSRLFNLVPTNGKKIWPMETNVELYNLVHKNIFYASVIAVDRKYPMLDVMLIDTSGLEDVNISDLLLEKNLATSPALEDVSYYKVKNVCDNCNKTDWLDLVPESFLQALYKVLPVWLVDKPFNDIDGIRREFRDMETYLRNGVGLNDLLCCPSHMTRAFFYSDPEEISNLWREALIQNNQNFIKALTKSITSLTSFEIKCQQMNPSFCNRFVFDNCSSSINMEPAASYTSEPSVITFKPVDNVTERKNFFPKENDTAHLADMTRDGNVKKGQAFVNNSVNQNYSLDDSYGVRKSVERTRSCEFLNSMRKSESRSENLNRTGSSMSRISSNRSPGTVRTLQIAEQEGQDKFVFEMELAPGLLLVLVEIINVLYVVKEQIIRDFARGMPSVLAQHRCSKLVFDPENIIVDPQSHPSIFRNLKSCGLVRDSMALLIPLKKAGNLLRVLVPQEKNVALAFDKLAQQYQHDIRFLMEDQEGEAEKS